MLDNHGSIWPVTYTKLNYYWRRQKNSEVVSLPKHVNKIGWELNLQDQLAKYHVYIHPSLHEGMPNTVLEAMGAGILVLLADTPELSELAGNQQLLFSALNAKGLSDKIMRLQDNHLQLESLLQITRNRAKELYFDWDTRSTIISIN